jgi:hypothetical protein
LQLGFEIIRTGICGSGSFRIALDPVLFATSQSRSYIRFVSHFNRFAIHHNFQIDGNFALNIGFATPDDGLQGERVRGYTKSLKSAKFEAFCKI